MKIKQQELRIWHSVISLVTKKLQSHLQFFYFYGCRSQAELKFTAKLSSSAKFQRLLFFFRNQPRSQKFFDTFLNASRCLPEGQGPKNRGRSIGECSLGSWALIDRFGHFPEIVNTITSSMPHTVCEKCILATMVHGAKFS